MASESSTTITSPVSTNATIPIGQNTIITFNAAAHFPLKLTPSNYPSWRAQFLYILTVYKLTGYLNGSKPCPPPPTKEVPDSPFELRTRQDQSIRHAILTLVSEPIAPYISKERLQNTRREGRTVTEFLHKLKVLADELAAIDKPLTNDDLTVYVLNGIGPEFCHGPTAHYAASTGPSTNGWLIDSGANNHITTNLSNLALHSEYNGSDELLIGDGSDMLFFMRISFHFGSPMANLPSHIQLIPILPNLKSRFFPLYLIFGPPSPQPPHHRPQFQISPVILAQPCLPPCHLPLLSPPLCRILPSLLCRTARPPLLAVPDLARSPPCLGNSLVLPVTALPPPSPSPVPSSVTPSLASPTIASASPGSALSSPLTPSPITHHTHPMITRSLNNIFKPKQMHLATKHPLPVPVEPSCVRQAVCHPHWRRAMSEEFDALRYKARLVVKGFHQRLGHDYSNTFSPVIKPTTIHTVFTIAVSQAWSIWQLDVNNAFLHGKVEEDLYMAQLAGFVDHNLPHHVCKLKKAIYGLKQAPRAWYTKLKQFLLGCGLVNSHSDCSLFIYNNAGIVVYVLVHVDDILITGNSATCISDLIHRLGQKFSLKDLGDLKAQNGWCKTGCHAYAYFWIVFLGATPISWKASKQKAIACSSTEAEYRALAAASSELVWVLHLLTELGIRIDAPPMLYCDNVGATYLSSNPVMHSRMKHIAIDLHFIRDLVDKKILRVSHIASADQLADGLTKPLSSSRFALLRSKIGITDGSTILWGRIMETHHATPPITAQSPTQDIRS
ncbi:hypothetical protein SLEP1_g34939 [Rubroshorea leprosula]|uniref:Reverse transcriptase Ty1/copia-type domain-containing protein n=1 Tax=Rubroshorea leprosula TaxID=152421 RepID=A0AAV5KLM1_9ROSI|nr:hypothetical protein SLEP1_g34939 [Rubroshorea leprosula]